jgi:hypothetical protein
MSRHRPLPLAALAFALVASGCGTAAAGGSSTERLVKGDWEFNHAFTGRDAVYADYDSVDEIRCAAKPDRNGDVACTLSLSSAKHVGRRLHARVLVHYDQQGIIQGWKLVPPARPRA